MPPRWRCAEAPARSWSARPSPPNSPPTRPAPRAIRATRPIRPAVRPAARPRRWPTTWCLRAGLADRRLHHPSGLVLRHRRLQAHFRRDSARRRQEPGGIAGHRGRLRPFGAGHRPVRVGADARSAHAGPELRRQAAHRHVPQPAMASRAAETRKPMRRPPPSWRGPAPRSRKCRSRRPATACWCSCMPTSWPTRPRNRWPTNAWSTPRSSAPRSSPCSKPARASRPRNINATWRAPPRCARE